MSWRWFWLLFWLGMLVLRVIPWLRVAQREHYEPGRVSRFARMWWVLGNPPVRGTRPGPLAWTRRMRTLALVTAALLVPLFYVVWAPFVFIATPFVIDLALLVTAPVERALGERWVKEAKRKLATVRPTVVAITGSYGKTSTKAYVAHLIAPVRTVVATPGSFNNRLGLARSINDHLVVGTQVFVAEMGTYGPGEIRTMCEWVTPKISAITAIGPVHLERFRSLERTLQSKAEILERAEVAILNADDARLAELATTVDKRVITTHASDPLVALAPSTAAPTNVAVAIAIARELGVGDDTLRAQLPTLPVPEHRLAVSTSDKGFTILDDTYNANPAGTRRALDALANQPGGGRRVVVTPGMYELGAEQYDENAAFAKAASAVATDLIVVGRTNRTALVAGAERDVVALTRVPTRQIATRWVRENLGPGDVVLYVNDQPDHYP